MLTNTQTHIHTDIKQDGSQYLLEEVTKQLTDRTVEVLIDQMIAECSLYDLRLNDLT